MNSTPRPEWTAAAAASIWSGVGEVKPWPGQAASSMPRPMKPACSGSCPEPPPDNSATFLPARSARATKVGSNSTRSRPGCASTRPPSDSRITDSMSLMNFFMLSPANGLSLLKHGVAHGCDRDLAGLAAGVDVAERALAEEGGSPLAGDHVLGGQHVAARFVLHPRSQRR